MIPVCVCVGMQINLVKWREIVFIHLGDERITIYTNTKVQLPKTPSTLNSSVLLLIWDAATDLLMTCVIKYNPNMTGKYNLQELCRECILKAMDLQIRSFIDLWIIPLKIGYHQGIAGVFYFAKKGHLMKTIDIN